MSGQKCRNCGLVNFVSATACKRCGENLTATPSIFAGTGPESQDLQRAFQLHNNFVSERLFVLSSKSSIVKQLARRGVTPEIANALIRHFQESAEGRKQMAHRFARYLWVGLPMFLTGLILVLVFYANVERRSPPLF